jgi:hypothetical protein
MNEKTSMKDIENAIGGYGDEFARVTFGTTEKTVEVLVKKRLSLADRKRFTDAVVDMCFVDDGEGNVLYCPYLKKFAFEYHIALFFTNIELSGDVEEVCEFLAGTDVVRRVAMSIDESYIGELFGEVNELIEYRKEALLKRSKLDDVLSTVSEIANSLGAKFEGEDGESVMKYLEANIPNFKDEIAIVLQEQQETKVINK